MSKIGTDVVVGTPIARRASFALDKFLANQQEIQQAYPGCRLVMATDEPDFVAELKEQISCYHLKGEVITYETVRPDYARSRVWSVTCAREALRRYVLSQGAEYLLSLDGDMIYAPSVISTMKARIQGFSVVSSGYRKAPYGVWGFGNGCLMLNREILDKIAFRCYEFKNGQEIDESETVDIELFRCHAHVNKGIFVYIKHYVNNQEYYEIEPQPVGWFRAMTNSLLLRNILVRVSIVVQYNIARKLQIWFARRAKFKLMGNRVMEAMSKTSLSGTEIIVGTPICRRTSFVLDKFLSNQQEIQQAYPDCSLVLATDEPDFVAELNEQVDRYQLNGEVITYYTVKPDYARSRIWSITCGREAIRKHALSREVEYLLFVDGDMVFEPTMLSILKDRVRGYDVLWSGYRFPPKGDLRFAAGCLMIKQNILSKIPFRCCEFSNKEIIFEDELFDADLLKKRARVKKGIFLFAEHYASSNEYVVTEPQEVSWFRKLTNSQLVRFLIVTASCAIRYNIPGRLHTLIYRAPGSSAKLFTETESGKGGERE